MAKIGRPNKYKSECCIEVIKLLNMPAMTDSKICKGLGISRSLFYQWLREIPDFKEAYDLGDPACQSWWEDVGVQGMAGQIPKFNVNAWLAFMKRKYKWGQDEDSKVTYKINNMNILQTDPNKLKLEIQKDLKKLGLDKFEEPDE